MRLVLDTNILVSFLIRKDTPLYLLYCAWPQQRFDLLTSAHQLAEVEAVLARPRLQAEVEQLATEMIQVAHSPDPDDNRILSIAIAGQADYVVSGDRDDILSLGEVESISIVTARQAVDILPLTSEPSLVR